MAWVDLQGRYRIAQRPVEAGNDRWEIRSPPVTARDNRAAFSYDPSEDLALALEGEEGLPHVVFRDSELGALRHLWLDAEGSWRLETIDDGIEDQELARFCPPQAREAADRGVGWWPDVVLGQAPGELAVAYHDADCGDLRMAVRRSERWLRAVVDDGARPGLAGDGLGARATVGRFASLATDVRAGGWLYHLAYYDDSRGQLAYALGDPVRGSFTVEVVDRGLELDEEPRIRKHLVGAFASLSLDDSGSPWISYFDATATSIKVARRQEEEDGWLRRRLEWQGPVGFWSDHAWDPALGRVYVGERLILDETDRYLSRLVLFRGEAVR